MVLIQRELEKMNKILIILLISSFQFAFAQEDGKSNKSSSSFGITVLANKYDYKFIDVKKNGSDCYFCELEARPINYSIGLSLLKKAFLKTDINIGLALSEKGYRTDWNIVENGGGSIDDPAIITTNHVIRFLDVPISFNYYCLNTAKFKGYIATGIINSFLLSNQQKNTFADGSTSVGASELRASYTKRYLFNISFGLGVLYNVFEKIHLGINPLINYYISDINYVLSSKTISYGINFGIYNSF